eukprot:CAMPEP_0204364454 /NCGR_PEP_ID=MMETSP0469-20131031/41153_1 /ASSEMBLY_ACC=CAM_ASM_000384 /TAXON_ID=2969 /ORGANISM="Oxyrrhis marina" /LENGTH=163 /DNA_ID=CAMNT_0051353357 /DNA_START=52 /DNA_END=540 /DNA_ORIENTATION=+
MTLPYRHAYNRVKLWAVNQVFPDAFVWKEFKEGVEEAFEVVHSCLYSDESGQLRHLLAEPLYDELRDYRKELLATPHHARTATVDSVECQGVMSGFPNSEKFGDVLLYVQVLFRTQETFTCPHKGMETVIHRTHKWTFTRALAESADQPQGDWVIADMSYKGW